MRMSGLWLILGRVYDGCRKDNGVGSFYGRHACSYPSPECVRRRCMCWVHLSVCACVCVCGAG